MAEQYPDLDADVAQILATYPHLTKDQAELVAKQETDISKALDDLASANPMWALTGLPNILEVQAVKPRDEVVANVICSRYTEPGYYAKAEWITREAEYPKERGVHDAVRSYVSIFRITRELEN